MIVKGKLYLSKKDILAVVREYEVPQPIKDSKIELIEINGEQHIVIDIEEECLM